MCFAPQRPAFFRHRSFKKWSEHAVFCAFWPANVCATAACHFSTSKLPKLVRSCGALLHFDLEKRFAPQPRAIFRHCNFKNCSGTEGFCAFWLENVLRVTAANEVFCSNFGLKMCFAPQRHAIFLSLLNSYLRTRRFTKPTFRTSGTTNHWKT